MGFNSGFKGLIAAEEVEFNNGRLSVSAMLLVVTILL